MAVASRAMQTDMMKFLQIIFHCALLVVYCALVVMFHELDRTIPISAALILAIPCTAVICAPLLLLPRRPPPLFEQSLHEGSTRHILPGSSGPAQKLIAEDRLRRLTHREIA